MQKNNPIIINVPHSSIFIPESEKKYFVTKYLQYEIDVMTDHFCDDLYDTGDTMLKFPVSRLICDPERFRDDEAEIMSSIGMGAIYTACSDGSKLKVITQEHKEEMLRKYYDKYHKRFENEVADKLRRFDKCLIIDGHSFYDEPLLYELDQDRNRPDICIGTDEYHTPKDLEDMMTNFFKGKGYSVEINRPFAGSIVPLKYYQKDKRVMSVMIEINRRLYIDHDIRKTSGYEMVKRDIIELISLLRKTVH